MKVLQGTVLLALLSCTRQGGTHGFRNLENSGQPPLPDVLVAPNGDLVLPGTIDEFGYLLPLDVLRDKAPKAQPARPRITRNQPRSSGSLNEWRLGPDDGHTQNETAIDADGSVVIAAWNQATDTSMVLGVARSADAGQTWSWQNLTGHAVMSDPVVAAAGGDRWYFAYMGTDLASSDMEIYVRRSLDSGLSWQAPVAVTQNTTFDDKPYLAAQGELVLVAWADFSFSPAKIRSAVSLDGGLSFIRHTVLANNSTGGNGASPVIAADGTLVVFWRDSFQQFLWLARSEDDGLTWTPDSQVTAMHPLPASMPPGYRIVNLPSAGANPQNGDLVVAWNDQAFGDPDILAVRSSNGGTTWSSPVRVNDDSSGQDQFFPWLDVDSQGGIHVVWYDKRQNGSAIDVFYAHSADGGASFSPNQRITAAPFSPILPWEAALAVFIGDYNGIAVTDQHVFPFYQDSRRGEQDVYAAVLNRGPVFTYPAVLELWPYPNILTIIPLLPPP